MPILIDRKTGNLLTAQKLTAEQNQKAWELIVKAYVEKHPEQLQNWNENEEKDKDAGPV